MDIEEARAFARENHRGVLATHRRDGRIDGTAEVLSLPEALEPLIGYHRRFSGEHPGWEEYREKLERERAVLIRITIERAGPDRKV